MISADGQQIRDTCKLCRERSGDERVLNRKLSQCSRLRSGTVRIMPTRYPLRGSLERGGREPKVRKLCAAFGGASILQRTP